MNFPFGETVLKVEQQDRTPKKVFILGVYASAVHAKWISSEGKALINALAVASEPYIFWNGDDAELIISRIKIPSEAGRLIAADKRFNGPSGKTLDTEYLSPLGLERKDCWLCDLVPYSMLNEGQLAALKRNEYLFEKYKLKVHDMKLAIKENRTIDNIRRNQILDEIKSSKAEYLITLGDEPIINFINYFDNNYKYLRNINKYGIIQDLDLGGYKVKYIPLTHPRQAKQLGNNSIKWFDKHLEWKIFAKSIVI